jgi:hypothetical protein
MDNKTPRRDDEREDANSSENTAGKGTSATGWDAPAPSGSGLTGTAEGIDAPPRGTIRETKREKP